MMVLVVYFFHVFNLFFCFVVSIFDLGHNIET